LAFSNGDRTFTKGSAALNTFAGLANDYTSYAVSGNQDLLGQLSQQ
jgi:hypothetical protein